MTRRSPGEGWTIRKHKDGYRTGYTDPSGKRRHIYAATAKEAKRLRDKAIADSQIGIIAPPHRSTVGAFMVAWVDDVAAHRLAPRTVERYRGIVTRHIVPSIGKVPMSKLTSQHIARLYAEKADTLAPASVRYVHAVLRSALAQAVSWRLLAVNPAQAVKPPRKPRNDIQPLNASEARALLTVAADDPLLALYVTALHTGMRLGELLGMTWDAIDWSRGTIEVRGTLQRKGPKEYRLEAPKTERSRRTVPMIDQLAEALRQHRSREVERLLALGYGRDDMRWVFTDRWGEPIYWGHVTDRLLRPLCRQAGIREIRFHDLRHTAASMLLSHGVPVHIVADILGHTSATTTLEVYAHLMPGDKEAAMRTLGAALGAVG